MMRVPVLTRAGWSGRRLRVMAPILILGYSSLIHCAAAEFDCMILPRQVVEIKPGTQGIIDAVHVRRGDTVSANQVLVTLDSGLELASAKLAKYRSEMAGAISAAESRVAFASQKSKRHDELGKKNFVSEQEREEAETERRLAEAELLEARENKRVAEYEYLRTKEQLRLRTVRSPFDGIVIDRTMNPGELADTSDTRKVIMKLADISVLHVDTLLPLAAYGRIEQGATYVVYPEEPLGGMVPATVKVIDKVMDPGSGTFAVRMEIPNKDGKLPSGIKCKVSIPGATGDEHVNSLLPTTGVDGQHGEAR